MSKTSTDGMHYEATGHKKPASNKQVNLQAAGQLGTPSLLWLLIKRHKVVILATGNVILVLNWALPEWPNMVRSIIGR